MESRVYNGHTYYQLYISCPVCYQRGKILPQTFWQHGDECSGDIYIGDNAHYHCVECDADAHVMEWKYSCPEHSSDCEDQYVAAEAGAMASVVSMAGQIVDKAGIAWLQTFLTNLENV